jgi:hypothetical protein
MKAPKPPYLKKFLCCFCVVLSLGLITRLSGLGRRDTTPFDVHKIRVFSSRAHLKKIKSVTKIHKALTRFKTSIR